MFGIFFLFLAILVLLRNRIRLRANRSDPAYLLGAFQIGAVVHSHHQALNILHLGPLFASTRLYCRLVSPWYLDKQSAPC